MQKERGLVTILESRRSLCQVQHVVLHPMWKCMLLQLVFAIVPRQLLQLVARIVVCIHALGLASTVMENIMNMFVMYNVNVARVLQHILPKVVHEGAGVSLWIQSRGSVQGI